jgi:hypothetical protein
MLISQPTARPQSFLFLAVIGIGMLVPLGAAFYKYYYLKDYDYIVETPCDSAKEICYTRDCSTGECPPNGLSEYKVFSVKAYDFPKCSNNSCKEECEKGLITCVPVPCGQSGGESCTDAK